jgi:hypothetical protein
MGTILHPELQVSYSHTLARAVSRRPLTAEARVLTQLSPCRICVDKVALAQVSPRVTRFSPVSTIPPWVSTLFLIWGINIRLVYGRS